MKYVLNFVVGLFLGCLAPFIWKAGILFYFGVYIPITLTWFFLINYDYYFMKKSKTEENKNEKNN
jgi:hypothetical protein